MAIELHLQKTTKTPWGFRLAGGVEYEVPLTVIKVVENSIAQNAGMQEGDVVVRINDIPVTGLTHSEAHDILLEAGDDFILAVRRGNLSHLPPRLLLYETSVENAEDIANPPADKISESGNKDTDLNITDEEIVNIIGGQTQLSSHKEIEEGSIEVKECEKTSIDVTEEINVLLTRSEVSKVLRSEESQTVEEKKWSTFLQKPKNLRPKPKVKQPEVPKAPPYQVIIKKQPKKSELQESRIEEHVSTQIEDSSDNIDYVQEDESLENNDDQNQTLDEPENRSIEENIELHYEAVESNLETEEDTKEMESTFEETGNIEMSLSEKRVSINLEEQLAQVQQQLHALAQLPSAIQQTLNAVTEQLSQIVLAKHAEEQEVMVEAKFTTEEEITEEYLDVQEEHEGKALSILEEESLEHFEEETTAEIKEEIARESIVNESEDEQVLFEELEKQIEEEERNRQEELEIRRLEQERIQKQDKEKRSSHPRTPLQRPIILPGGRKWSNPDDAVSKARRPSMTEEKIANTINMFSEVNHWNSTWPWSHTEKPVYRINFLKYQPPPKNLDFLQKSAVYRLVHDIEPPARGLSARDSKILAEQDYHVNIQES